MNVTTRTSSWLLAGLPVALLLFLFWRTLYETGLICWQVEDYSHGLLLPFISGYFLYTHRDDMKRTLSAADRFRPQTSFYLGGAILFVGMGLFLLGDVANLLFIRWLAFFVASSGALVLILGLGHSGPFIGPLLLNFMAKPLPDSLVPKLFFPLQVMAARVSASVLEWLNVPVYLRGNIIEIPGMQLMVEEACSGLRSLMALLTVACIVLYSLELRFIGKVILLLASVFIAIALNVVRVASTGLLAHFYDPKAATGFFHTFSGLVVFVVGLVILYYVGTILQKIFHSARNK